MASRAFHDTKRQLAATRCPQFCPYHRCLPDIFQRKFGPMLHHISVQDRPGIGMFSLAGKVALVTGASRGIGAATAKLLARHGAAVGVNYVTSEACAQAVVAEIEAVGGHATAVRGSVGDPDEVARMVG